MPKTSVVAGGDEEKEMRCLGGGSELRLVSFWVENGSVGAAEPIAMFFGEEMGVLDGSNGFVGAKNARRGRR